MGLRELTRRVVRRLEQGDRGDRGWFLITRVHLNPARLRDIATYLHDVGASDGHRLEAADYTALGRVTGIAGRNPGVTLRRHHLLAMERPLDLLRRVDGRRWREVRLTELGTALATTPNTSAVLERALGEIRFCQAPWYPPRRVKEYKEFDVHPYRAALQVMAVCDGWVDRDEFDLFLSRVRRPGEIQWAIEGIREFRRLAPADRTRLLKEVRRRVPSSKAYRNWRDMGPHTFSLLALGTSAFRAADQRLILTERLVELAPAMRRRAAGPPPSPRARPAAALRIPTPAATSELGAPPAAPAVNPGTDGEVLVGKLLQAAGWEVVFYTNRRGFGFDIWARRGRAAMVVEVKSSFEELGPLTLTRLEYKAAAHHGPNYVLATVENLSTDAPIVRFIQDPVRVLRIEERTTREYHIAREAWAAAAETLDLRRAH